MGSGCFSPAANPGQIDIEILEALYEEGRSASVSEPHDTQQIKNAYRSCKQKIMKKGSLKKMCDYLSSHRFRLYDNILHSYRVVSQSKSMGIKIVAVIVLEQLIGMVPEHEGMANNSQKNIQNIRDNPSSVTFHRLQNHSENQLHTKSISTTRFIKTEQSEANPSSRAISSLVQEMTLFKFEGVFLSLTYLLLKEGGEIYKLILGTLIRYCSFCRGKFSSHERSEDIMKVLSYHVETNEYLSQSLRAFRAMLVRVCESYLSKNLQLLRCFICLWEKSEELGSEKMEGERKVFEKIKMGSVCHEIITEFIANSFDSTDFEVIFQVIVELLDQKQFEEIHKIEQLIVEIIHELDLKDQFRKGLFLYFLSYASFPETNKLNKAWYDTFHGVIAKYRVKYKKIEEPQTKVNSIAKIAQWLRENTIIEANDLLTYHCNSVVSLFTFNLFSAHQQVKDKAISEFISLAQHLLEEDRLRLIDGLLAQINDDHMEDKERYTVLCMGEKIIEKEGKIEMPQGFHHFFPLINPAYCLENNLKVIDLTTLVYRKITLATIEEFMHPICQFFISLSEELAQGYSNSHDKISLIQAIAKLAKAVPDHYRGILQAFAEKLAEENLEENISEIGKPNIFFIDLLLMEIISSYSPISIETGVQKMIESVRNKILKKESGNVIMILDEYSQSRKSISLPESKISHPKLHSEAKNHFQAYIHKENELLISKSIFGNVRSVISVGSINGRDDEIGDVLDVLRR